ncbi:MAG TPA: hypothetical protein VLF14_05355 [Candidatus Binatia bacterium]|nr:hypothetical protein [Candidatus Binatia bacterium]
MTLQIARLLTESVAAVGHLTPIELSLAGLGFTIEVTALAALRILSPRRSPLAEPHSAYDEAA